MGAPTIGLFAVNSHVCAEPEAAVRIAELAESLGYDSLWAGEHVVVPSPRVDPSPMEPEEPILDPLVALAHLAARTERIRLGTGVIILPQRNPLVLAKQVASLDVLSGGRLILGIGVAYLEPEMRAVGVPMEGRGTRSDEYLAAMRSLWEDDTPAFRGRFVDFEGVDAHPRPMQRPLPVVSRRPHRAGAPARGPPRGRVVRVPDRPAPNGRAARVARPGRSSAPGATARCTSRSRRRARSTPRPWPPTPSSASTG